MFASSNIKTVSAIDDKIKVTYEDGTTKIYQKKSEEGNTMSGKGSTQYQSGSYQGAYYAGTNDAKMAFTCDSIEFWGMPKTKLDTFKFTEGDLIINLTGYAWTPTAPKTFIKSTPSWLNLEQVYASTYNNSELAEQVVLDWIDFKAPPLGVDNNFWENIYQQAKENNVKRILICCQAGQGRTGTALASFALSLGVTDSPDIAIDYIRANYNKSAIENKEQEKYLFDLVYEEVEEVEDK